MSIAPAHSATTSGSSGPNSHTMTQLELVLERNRSYQTFLQTQLQQLDQLLTINQEKRRLVEEIQERTTTGGVTTTPAAASTNRLPNAANGVLPPSLLGVGQPLPRKLIFQSPMFIDANGATPPPNMDTLRKARLRGSMPKTHRFVKWSQEEKSQLLAGIKQQNQKAKISRELAKAKELFQLTGNLGDMNPAKFKELSARAEHMTPDDFILDADEIDWNLIAGRYVRSRSAIDCKIAWTCNDDPRINRSEWGKQEQQALVKLAEKHQAHEWIEIAKELGTNRTAIQCFQEFQRNLNPNIVSKARFTNEEDHQLSEYVAKYGDENWSEIASRMKLRTEVQCASRWNKSLNPAIRAGRWSEEETLRLRLATMSYGGKNSPWTKVQLHIPGRTDMKCRERFTNVLEPSVTTAPWSLEEDQRLLDAVKLHGVGKWTKIAKECAPRTDNQCLRRYRQLTKVQPPASSNEEKSNEKVLKSLAARLRHQQTMHHVAEDFPPPSPQHAPAYHHAQPPILASIAEPAIVTTANQQEDAYDPFKDDSHQTHHENEDAVTPAAVVATTNSNRHVNAAAATSALVSPQLPFFPSLPTIAAAAQQLNPPQLAQQQLAYQLQLASLATALPSLLGPAQLFFQHQQQVQAVQLFNQAAANQQQQEQVAQQQRQLQLQRQQQLQHQQQQQQLEQEQQRQQQAAAEHHAHEEDHHRQLMVHPMEQQHAPHDQLQSPSHRHSSGAREEDHHQYHSGDELENEEDDYSHENGHDHDSIHLLPHHGPSHHHNDYPHLMHHDDSSHHQQHGHDMSHSDHHTDASYLPGGDSHEPHHLHEDHHHRHDSHAHAYIDVSTALPVNEPNFIDSLQQHQSNMMNNYSIGPQQQEPSASSHLEQQDDDLDQTRLGQKRKGDHMDQSDNVVNENHKRAKLDMSQQSNRDRNYQEDEEEGDEEDEE